MDFINMTGLMPRFLLQGNPVNVPDSFKDTFNFLQGNGVYEEGVMHFLKGMKNTIWTHFDTFITDAQALAAIFMLIFFAIKSYEMMAGDKKMEIMPLLRPFGLAWSSSGGERSHAYLPIPRTSLPPRRKACLTAGRSK
ncbi:hypothetical protein [Sphingobacterium sp. 1.A.5]|uniref:hypothetical protein n=1 Tax=Sphingobacterium sp. 1.A.5 TaxID=2044604 RepID=UPI00211EB496|nr:hypothetical protein [Sphingobacterium sp. 1.A.5]